MRSFHRLALPSHSSPTHPAGHSHLRLRQAKPITRAANLARPLFASSTRDRLLIAASDRARASGSLDGYRPAAPVAPVIGIIVIPTIALTVAGSTNVN